MKTLYQYTIKTGGGETCLTGYKQKTPIAMIWDDAEKNPTIAADLLRGLAKWAIEQAEIIEELETGKPIPERKILDNYAAEIVEVTA